MDKILRISIQCLYITYDCTTHYEVSLHADCQKFYTPVSYILKRIADKTLTLFNSIAVSNGEGIISIREMNLTTKQYYSRISGLLNAGLVKRNKGKHSLTLLGKVVYNSQIAIGKALNYYWKLQALESIQTSSSPALPSAIFDC